MEVVKVEGHDGDDVDDDEPMGRKGWEDCNHQNRRRMISSRTKLGSKALAKRHMLACGFRFRWLQYVTNETTIGTVPNMIELEGLNHRNRPKNLPSRP